MTLIRHMTNDELNRMPGWEIGLRDSVESDYTVPIECARVAVEEIDRLRAEVAQLTADRDRYRREAGLSRLLADIDNG